MSIRKIAPFVLLSVSVTTPFAVGDGDTRYRDIVQLQQLQSDFHGAGAKGDRELMASIWTQDSVFRGGGSEVRGRDNIVDFLRRGASWGKSANLAPTYKTTYDIKGNKATIRFECVIVRVDGSSPLTTALSTLPPGKQNKDVEIVQHSNTTIEAKRVGNGWKIHRFNGKGGAIQ